MQLVKRALEGSQGVLERRGHCWAQTAPALGREKDHLIYTFVSLQRNPSIHICDPYSPAHLQPNSLSTHACNPTAHPSTPMTLPIHSPTPTSLHPSPPTALQLIPPHLQPANPHISTSTHPYYNPKDQPTYNPTARLSTLTTQRTNNPTAPPSLQPDPSTLHSTPQTHPPSSKPTSCAPYDPTTHLFPMPAPRNPTFPSTLPPNLHPHLQRTTLTPP